MATKTKTKNNFVAWYEKTWRPAMAFLYLLLCFGDYAIRPVINMYFFKEFNLAETVATINGLDSTVQIQIIETLRSEEAIQPILSEFVHISFGAILGVAAYTRGREELERVRRVNPKALEPISEPINPNMNEKDEEEPTTTGAMG